MKAIWNDMVFHNLSFDIIYYRVDWWKIHVPDPTWDKVEEGEEDFLVFFHLVCFFM